MHLNDGDVIMNRAVAVGYVSRRIETSVSKIVFEIEQYWPAHGLKQKT